MAGDRNVKSSYLLSKEEALELFPMLRSDKLVGAIVYYDGQQDDARMNLAIALTAARHGAAVCNHIEVTELLKKKDSTGKEVCAGAKVRVSARIYFPFKTLSNGLPLTGHLHEQDMDDQGQVCDQCHWPVHRQHPQDGRPNCQVDLCS